MFNGPIYFNCYPDFLLLMILIALTLNILTSGYDTEDGSKPLAIIYRIYYKLLKTKLNPHAKLKNAGDNTLLIQCSKPDAKVTLPKMIRWKDITLPNEWKDITLPMGLLV